MFLILSFVYLRNRRPAQLLLLCVALLCGSLAMANAKLIPSSSIAHLTPYKKKMVTLKGFISSAPVLRNGKTRFVFTVSELRFLRASRSVSGGVLVRCNGKQNLVYGDQLLIKGNLYRPYDYRPGYADYLRRRGIYSIMSARGKEDIKKTGLLRGNRLKYFALVLKDKAKRMVARNVSGFSASILNAMLFGERGNLPHSLKQMMTANGTWHVLVISGLHTGMVAFMLLLFLKILKVPRGARYFCVMGLLVFYCMLAGGSVPVVRATVMIIAILAGYLIKRVPIFYNSFCLAALIILLFDPVQLFDAGFQLSFLSVFFIFWLSPKIEDLFPATISKNSFLRRLIQCFCVSFSAWLGTAPLIAYTFGNFSLVAVLANMAVVPVAMLVVTCGFTLLVFEGLCPFLAQFIAASEDFFIFALFKINLFFSNLPFASLAAPGLHPALVIGFYIFIFLSVSFSCNLKNPQ